MTKRTKYGVDFMAEGEILVRGTREPMEALRIYVEHADEGYSCYIEDAERRDEDPKPEDVRALGDHLHRLLKDALPGYYRKVNCLPGSYGEFEGWGWALHPAEGPGRGAFEAVEFPS